MDHEVSKNGPDVLAMKMPEDLERGQFGFAIAWDDYEVKFFCEQKTCADWLSVLAANGALIMSPSGAGAPLVPWTGVESERPFSPPSDEGAAGRRCGALVGREHPINASDDDDLSPAFTVFELEQFVDESGRGPPTLTPSQQVQFEDDERRRESHRKRVRRIIESVASGDSTTGVSGGAPVLVHGAASKNPARKASAGGPAEDPMDPIHKAFAVHKQVIVQASPGAGAGAAPTAPPPSAVAVRAAAAAELREQQRCREKSM